MRLLLNWKSRFQKEDPTNTYHVIRIRRNIIIKVIRTRAQQPSPATGWFFFSLVIVFRTDRQRQSFLCCISPLWILYIFVSSIQFGWRIHESGATPMLCNTEDFSSHIKRKLNITNSWATVYACIFCYLPHLHAVGLNTQTYDEWKNKNCGKSNAKTTRSADSTQSPHKTI